MNDPSLYLSELIQSKARRRFFVGCAILAGMAWVLFTQKSYLLNVWSGPRPIDDPTLEAELVGGDLRDLNIDLKLSPKGAFESGYTLEFTEETAGVTTSTSIGAEYYFTPVGKHLLVLEGTPTQVPKGHFSGWIVPLRADLKGKLAQDLSEDVAPGTLLPYMVTTRGMKEVDEFWLIGFCLIVFAIFGGLAIRRAFDLKHLKHEAYRIAPLAGYPDLQGMSEAFARSDLTGAMALGPLGRFKLNREFLFLDGLLFFNLYPMAQLEWAYKKVIQRRSHFIPLGKEYHLVLHFKTKQKVEIKESEAKVNEHLLYLATLCPQARFGYSK